MNSTLLTAGLACVIAGIIGGGLKAWGIEIPVLQSWKRQAILIGFGVVLILMAQPPAPQTAASPAPSSASEPVLPSSKEQTDALPPGTSNSPPSSKWSGFYTNIKTTGKTSTGHSADVVRMEMKVWSPPDQGNGTMRVKLTSSPGEQTIDCEMRWDVKLYATDKENYLDYTFDNRLVLTENHCYEFGLIPIRGGGRVTAYNEILDNAFFLTGPFEVLGSFQKKR